MQKLLIVVGVTGLFVVPARAGYVGSVVGIEAGGAHTSSLTVSPGDSFQAEVLLTGDVSERSDSAVFRLVFSAAGLELASGWCSWSSPYTTGGPDDFSDPAPAAAGMVTASLHDDPIAIGEVDLYFENLTDSANSLFTTGTLLSLQFNVPQALAGVGSFTISFAPESFTNGASLVDTEVGQPLTVNVVPNAGTAGLLLLTGLAGVSRRRAR